MNNQLKNIDPQGIIVNADGSVTIRDKQLNAAISDLSSGPITMSSNAGNCTNVSTCTGINYDCVNTGNCTKANNVGHCHDTQPIND